jgi:hypothetical protein
VTVQPAVRALDLARYREAVVDIAAEIASPVPVPVSRNGGALARVETVLARRLDDPELAGVLSATQGSPAAAGIRLLADLGDYRAEQRATPADAATLLRISLLAQIDALWWGSVRPYPTDEDVADSVDLVDLARLRLPIRFRRQPATRWGRARRAAVRRLWPDRSPHTAGLRSTRTRPELGRLLGELARAFDAGKPAGCPSMWVTSLARSVAHQRRLRRLGYPALLPSAHCVGYAVDVELFWFRRFGADDGLRSAMLDRQADGDLNVIDEGQAWHVCISPTAVARFAGSAGARPAPRFGVG